MLNSISLRYFPAHPTTGQISEIWAILANCCICKFLTTFFYLSLLYLDIVGQFLGHFIDAEKWKNTHFRPIWPFLGIWEQKTGKKRLFDQFMGRVVSHEKYMFYPTLQAIKGKNRRKSRGVLSEFKTAKPPLSRLDFGAEGEIIWPEICAIFQKLLFCPTLARQKTVNWAFKKWRKTDATKHQKHDTALSQVGSIELRKHDTGITSSGVNRTQKTWHGHTPSRVNWAQKR